MTRRAKHRQNGIIGDQANFSPNALATLRNRSTDEANAYKYIAEVEGLSHETVNHSKDEYVRGDITTNTVEGYYSIFKHEGRLSALR